MIAVFRTLFLIAGCCCSLVNAAELRVAIGVQDAAQIAMQGQALPDDTPGREVIAFSEDIAREICRRLNAHCRVSYVVFAEILPGVENGRFDLGFGNFLRTPEREKRVAFSDAIWRSSSRLVGTPATAKSFADRLGQPVTLASLRDARVVALENSQQFAFLKRIARERKLTVLGAATPAAVISALRDNTADFALLPILTAYAQLRHDDKQQFEFVGPALASHGLGGTVNIALPRQRNELRHSVNRALAACRADGTFQRTMHRHFPVNMD